LAGASVQSTTGSWGVRISGSNAGNTVFRGSVRVLATHSIRQFPLHFPTRASPCAIRFQLDSTHSVDSAALNAGTMFQKNCMIGCSAEGQQQNGTAGDVPFRGRRKQVYLRRIREDEINRNKDNHDRCRI
jgi:hypothetical protein